MNDCNRGGGGMLIKEGFKSSAHYGNVFSNFLGGWKIKKSVKKMLGFVVLKIMNHSILLPPFKQAKCKSYEVVKDAIKDHFAVAKLKFSSFIASHLKPYLTIFQSQKPLISFLYDDLQSLYKELLELTIKSNLLKM